MKKAIPVILLLIVFFILVIASVFTKSPICDEAGHHIAAGYSYIKTLDFRMNPSAPPLLRILIGLPLLSLDLKIPLDHPSWLTNNSTEFSHQFLYIYNHIAERIVFLARLSMIVLSMLLGLLIFLWSKKLYGYNAGLFAFFLYTFSPTILANAGLAMLDMGSTFFIFLATFQLFRYLQNKNQFNLILSGVCFGLAQASKHTALILFPLFLIFMLMDVMLNKKEKVSISKMIKSILWIWLIGFFILWAMYLFEFKPLLQNTPDIKEKMAYLKSFSNLVPFVNPQRLSTFLIHIAEDAPIPLSTYIVSLGGVVKTIAVGQGLTFFGLDATGGSKIYYLINYIIKTPLAEIFFIVMSIFLIKKRTKAGFFINSFLLLPIFAIFISASFSRLQGGLRYILPMYPFLFVWLSDIVNIKIRRGAKVFKVALVGLGTWYLFSSLFAYPHYLAYFNELVGGPSGFGYKITDDIDWGQDIKALKKYMDKKGIKEIRMHCFGTADPAYYGIKYREVEGDELRRPVPGSYYAISSRALHSTEWTKNYLPIDKVGHTIFIYYTEDKRPKK